MWWAYGIAFIGSLGVALISVRISQWWSDKRDYRKALQNLKSELSTNIKVARLICTWADMNIESLKNGKIVVASCPRFNDSVWISVKGSIAANDYSIVTGLEDAYLMVVVVNDLLRTTDGLKWEIGGTLPNVGQRVTLMLDAAKQIVKDKLVPMLENDRNLLDKRLKKPGSHK